ncbi:MAG: hypothetical protein JWO53_745 [Chlamydiia bacterium]|nr:hypothetical protein [Chlamydiia bacterium]
MNSTISSSFQPIIEDTNKSFPSTNSQTYTPTSSVDGKEGTLRKSPRAWVPKSRAVNKLNTRSLSISSFRPINEEDASMNSPSTNSRPYTPTSTPSTDEKVDALMTSPKAWLPKSRVKPLDMRSSSTSPRPSPSPDHPSRSMQTPSPTSNPMKEINDFVYGGEAPPNFSIFSPEVSKGFDFHKWWEESVRSSTNREQEQTTSTVVASESTPNKSE